MRRQLATSLVVSLGLLQFADSLAARPYIDLGTADGLALDQPRVAVEIFTKPASGSPVSLGPEFSNTFLLDTGASTVMAVGAAVGELNTAGYQTVAVYDEQGVAGSTPTDVSQIYRLDYAGSTGVRQSLDSVRLLSTADLDFGSFSGIVGMPAMVGKQVTLDMTGWSNGSSITLDVHFPAAAPAAAAHRYEVPLTLVDFPLTGQRNASDPLPTSAPLPFAPVLVRFGDNKIEGQFVVDTGAQVSILSRAMAFALGLDANHDGNFDDEKIDELPVGGIGGEVLMPIVNTDSLGIRTTDGTDITWKNLSIGIQDIDPQISGVIGMDLLTSGWFEKVFGGSGPDGFLNAIHFDFADAGNHQGRMLLDVNAALDIVGDLEPWQNWHEPNDVNGANGVTPFDALLVINELNANGSHDLAAPNGEHFFIDVSGDNRVTPLDALLVINEINAQSSFAFSGALIGQPVAVPEPSSAMLAAIGLFVVLVGYVYRIRVKGIRQA